MKYKQLIYKTFIHTDFAPQCIWSLFYPDKPQINYTNEKNSNITEENPEENSIFFFDCSFFNLNDGCILIIKDGLKFLHSFCRFSNNTREGMGGCIYFSGNMQIVQHRLCAYDIKPKGHSGYCYIHLYDPKDIYYYDDYFQKDNYNYNYFLENSLTKCINSEQHEPIILGKGLIRFSSTNSSGNDATEGPGYVLGGPTSNSSSLSIVNYSTFEGNKANKYILGHYWDGFFIITKSNILNNTSQEKGHLFSQADSVEFNDCSFFGNKGSALFYRESGGFIVRNCFIDNFTQNSLMGRTVLNESIDTNQMTYVLSHCSTQGCIAAYPQPINFNPLSISYFLTASETIPQTNSCKYKKFFRGSVKGKF